MMFFEAEDTWPQELRLFLQENYETVFGIKRQVQSVSRQLYRRA